MKTVRELTCAVCGGMAGKWEQHRNQDTGYGICSNCVVWLRGRGETSDRIKKDYGTEGVNWGKGEHENA